MSRLRIAMKRTVTALALTGLAVTAITGCSADKPVTESTATGTPIKIGVVVALSNTAVPGSAAVEGFKAWAAAVNGKGGLQGHPVEIIVQDDGNDPAKSLTAVKQLVEGDSVVALTSWTSNEASWSGYVEEKKIPVIGGSSYAPIWQSSPDFFPVQSTLQTALLAQPVMAKNADATSLGNFYAAEMSSAVEALGFKEDIARQVGIDGSFNAAISSSQPDYTAACLSAKKAGVDAMSLSGVPAERVAPGCAQQDFNPLWVLPGETVTDTLQKVPALANLLAPQFSFPFFLDVPQTADYRAAMKKDYRGPADAMFSPLTSSAWMAGLVYENVLDNIGVRENITSADFFEGLYKVKDLTADGLLLNLSYSPDDTQRIVKCFWETGLDEGDWIVTKGIEATCTP